MEEEVWNEFNQNWESLAFESEKLIAQFSNERIEERFDIKSDEFQKGLDKEMVVKSRVNQSFFRSTILSSYYSKCCITGISIPELLVASHIIPWSKNGKERLNPRNGLCLNALHDRAFDRGYFTINSDYSIQLSKCFDDFESNQATKDYFQKIDKRKISLPDKFLPSKEFLEYHKQKVFKK